MKFICVGFTAILFLFTTTLKSQYAFSDEIRIPCSEVKNQQATGTCWSFGTTSFLESEILRIKKTNIDLSEMFNVRMAYQAKAWNYVMRQGKAQFSEGGLPHDVIHVAALHGIMPQEAYSGKTAGDTIYDHGELQAALDAYLGAVIKNNKPTTHWMTAVNGILDAYLGPLPQQFSWNGKNYTSQSLKEALGIDASNYVSFTSFTHHPFYSNFILEIPDNFANGSFFNVKLDELINIIDNALSSGYSLSWDADVSEKGFSSKTGLAILPLVNNEESLSKPGEELLVTEKNRQENFNNYKTTDDHIMHIVGRAYDQNKKKYYIIKNSWGSYGPYKGYSYVSEAYMKMKTISVTVHKDGVAKNIAKRMRESQE